MTGYDSLIEEIVRLPEDDEYGAEYLAPSLNAIRRSLAFLSQVLQGMHGSFPAADPVPDGAGGFRLFWAKPGKNVQFNVPANDTTPLTLFLREGSSHALSEDPSPQDVAERLIWFAST